jgi:glycine oxidase
MVTSRPVAEILIVGGGVVGLCCAISFLDRGARVMVFSDRRPGEASPAAAGMLAPGVERAHGGSAFSTAARDRWPAFVDMLSARTGAQIALLRNGILQLAAGEEEADALRAALPEGARWLDAREVAALEPALAPVAGALLHPLDGAVDNIALVRALERRLEVDTNAQLLREPIARLDFDGRPSVLTETGGRREGEYIVLAGGAWVPQLRGLPRPVPIEPIRGQIMSLDASPLGHVVYGPGGYLVPRRGATLAGSTMERAGFDVSTTDEALAAITATAERICPALAGVAVRDAWSGLRPCTPDLLPIIDQDDAHPQLLHACGHSRNGILLSPLTAECVVALAAKEEPPMDISPYRIARFAAR